MGERSIAGRGVGLCVAVVGVIALAGVTVLLALQGRYNHDEEQYVAAAVLTARVLRPILDFPYLQSPLQPWVLAPVFGWMGGHVFLAARLASAALALAALACGFGVVRRAGGSPAFAALAMVAVAGSGAVRTLEATGRNDALPCALMAAGVLALVLWDGLRRRPGLAALAGLLLSLSLSTKLTYVFAPAAGGLWLLLASAMGRASWRDVLAFALGAAVGLLPIVATFAFAPTATLFDMVGFHRGVTPAWYGRNGLTERRDLLFHLAFWGGVPLREPPTVAAVLGLLAFGAASVTGRAKVWIATPARRIAGMVALFAAPAVVAASLPNPAFTAYAAPPVLLTILAAAAALAGMRPGVWRTGLATLGLVAAVAGWAPAVGPAVSGGARPQDWTVSRLHATACAARDAMRAAGLRGPVATLSPIRALDCGLEAYPEFAPGPFLFRSGDDVTAATVAVVRGATPQTLEALFARRPPAAILTGYERGAFRIDADAALDAWARAHGFREVALPDGGRLYLRSS